MIGKSERRSVEFLEWEARGRGFQVWDFPVVPEPLFQPLLRHGRAERDPGGDDGRKPTLLSALVRRVSQRFAPDSRECVSVSEGERSPKAFFRDKLVELQAYVPANMRLDLGMYAAFFQSLRTVREPAAFEIVGLADSIRVQFAVGRDDEAFVSRQLATFFPEVSFAVAENFLSGAWDDLGQPHVGAVEFGLGKEFMIPFAGTKGDAFVGLTGALSAIAEGEIGVFQVLFSPVEAPWGESVMRSVTRGDGSAYFINAPELVSGATQKTELPLFAAVVRLAAKSSHHDRTWEILCEAASALGAYGTARGNALIPLANDGYPRKEHEEDVVRRQTHRSGMILNAAELAGFVHFPSSEVRAPKLRLGVRTTKAVPSQFVGERGIRLGTNEHRGVLHAVSVSSDERVRHTQVVGASGTGKSTLLFNLIRQDLENGEGISVIDPHGDLIDRVLGIIPEHRIPDVVLLDPSDEESTVGFNILSAHSDWEKNLLASDLVSVFRRLSSAWGDQLNSVLSNALLAFMESDRGGTLVDVRRFLLEPAFRNEFLYTVRDSNILYYWQQAFPKLSGNKSVGPVVTRLDTFLSPKPIRLMVGQQENRLDFGDIMDSGKIFLAKLSQGAIGKENSHLLGSLIVSKLQAKAMARQRLTVASRRFHFLYADEFHDFLTPSLAECLTGVRKYRLGLILAHQEMRQVERDGDVASALLNAYTRIVFRVNDRDARSLESGFSGFEAKDLQNLGTGEAVCRIERSDSDFNLRIDAPAYPDESEAGERRRAVIKASRMRYGVPRAEAEAAFGKTVPAPAAPTSEKKEPPKVVAKDAPPARAPTAVPKDEAVSAAPADLGKGGAQHKAIQDRIKEEAEKLGFRVTVEKELPDGLGQIDLVLTRDDAAIACEVTVTTTIDHEVGNVAKCVKAGYRRIVLVAVSEDKLGKLSAAVRNSLGETTAAITAYYLPDALIAALGEMKPAGPKAESLTRTRGGRVVRRTVVALSPEEAKARENQALRLMAEMMRKKNRSDAP